MYVKTTKVTFTVIVSEGMALSKMFKSTPANRETLSLYWYSGIFLVAPGTKVPQIRRLMCFVKRSAQYLRVVTLLKFSTHFLLTSADL